MPQDPEIAIKKSLLQVFHIDVAKVDRDVAYIAMAIYVYCEPLFQMFYFFFGRMLQVFYLDVVYISHICCKCFRHMFHVFHMFSDACCKCVHLDVSKVDQILYIL
jgi:hypothetical protein